MYLQLCNWDLIRNKFMTTPINKDLGGLIVIEYGGHTSLQTSNSKQDDLTLIGQDTLIQQSL